MADYTVRQGDNFTIADTLEDAAGSPVNIQGAAIKFTLIPIGGGAAILDQVAATNAQNTDGSDGSKGKVTYTGGGAASATPGKYLASWYNATTLQTFPNGGYILFEVTADAPVAAATRFAESSDLEARLGLTFSADEHVRAQTLLELASRLIQDETKQTIALVTGDSLTTRGVYGDRFRLPQRPVVSVASVAIDGVTVDAAAWYLDGDEICRSNWPSALEHSFQVRGLSWGGPSRILTVVYTHGYTAVPAIAKAVCMEAAVRVWVNPGAVIQERIADESTTYAPFTGNAMPVGLTLTVSEKEALNDKLRRTSGTLQLR